MLRQGCFIIISFIAILIAIPIVAANYLPGWAVFLIILSELAALRFGIPFLIKFGVKRFAVSMIQTKSRVLRGAGVHIHRVERTSAPANAKQIAHEQSIESDAGEATLMGAIPADDRYVLVEFTLTPRAGESKSPASNRGAMQMQFYDPSELVLVPFEKSVDASMKESADDSDSAALQSITQIDPNGVEHDDVDKLAGPARLRAVFSIPPTMSGRVKFQYYFETFGDFLLQG